MRFYETVFIARQDITPSQVEAIAQHYNTVVRDYGGEVTKTEFCGLRNLAYRIKKNKKGHYVLMNISVNSEGITEIDRQLKLNEDVLRHLVVKVDVLDNSPSHLMQQRNFREDRSRSFSSERGDFDGAEGDDSRRREDRPMRDRYDRGERPTRDRYEDQGDRSAPSTPPAHSKDA